MVKTIASLLSLLLVTNFVPTRSTQGKDYIICGNNTQQKIYYATSSNFSKNHKGEKALDDDEETSWISKQGGDQWIEIDFGVKRIMTDIEITTGTKDNYNTITYCILQFMYDGKMVLIIRGVNFYSKTIKKKFFLKIANIKGMSKVHLKGY